MCGITILGYTLYSVKAETLFFRDHIFCEEVNGMESKINISFLVIGIIFLSISFSYGEIYPEKTIKILCPFTPGSSTDLISRLIAEISSKYLNRSVVVINKPGAAGSVAAADVINSPPDGYKLVKLTNVFFATIVKIQNFPLKGDDLIPIANFVEYKLGIIVKDNSPFKTFFDLLDYGKNNPGRMRWSHPGRGTTLHLNFLLILRRLGIDTIDVPYKGTPEQLSALLGGHVDASAVPYGAVKHLVKAGKIRCLIFFSDRRFADPSDVPSTVELGFPEASKYISVGGLFAHKNTPENIKSILIDAFKKTCEDPEFKKGLEKIGEEPRCGGPDFLKDAIKRGEEVGIPIIKELGLY